MTKLIFRLIMIIFHTVLPCATCANSAAPYTPGAHAVLAHISGMVAHGSDYSFGTTRVHHKHPAPAPGPSRKEQVLHRQELRGFAYGMGPSVRHISGRRGEDNIRHNH